VPSPKLTKLELQIMEALWSRGALSFVKFKRPFPSGTDSVLHHPDHSLSPRREKAPRRARKISNAHIVEACVSRNAARGKLIDDLLSLFDGRTQPVMAHLVESGKLTLEEVQETEELIRKLARKDDA
jgi:BlaI family transcriptional regulator, penicillinase repressor